MRPFEVTADSEVTALVLEQKKHLDYFFAHFNPEPLEELVERCHRCSGLLIFCGVGKSGIVSEKIVMTLVSTGTRAVCLPVGNFLHGDVGIVSSEDIVIMLSKSGETEELLKIIPHIRKKRSALVAVVSTLESSLEKKADHTLYLPVEKELCPFDLAPTTSTAVQLLFGDLLAMALMRKKGVTLDTYAVNHPLGTIGKKVIYKIADIMLQKEKVPLCLPNQKLIDVLVDLSNKKCGCLLVTLPDRTLLGIFTDGDLRRALQMHGGAVLEQTMDTLMTPSPIFVSPSDRIVEAIDTMQRQRPVMVAPVVDQGKVVGLVHMHAIVSQIKNES